MTPLGPEWEAIENVKDPAIKAALLALLRMMPAPVSGADKIVEQMHGEPPANITVRQAARIPVALSAADAQALEHALTVTERERDEALRSHAPPSIVDATSAKHEADRRVADLTRENLALMNERDELRRELEVERSRRERAEKDRQLFLTQRDDADSRLGGQADKVAHLRVEIDKLRAELAEAKRSAHVCNGTGIKFEGMCRGCAHITDLARDNQCLRAELAERTKDLSDAVAANETLKNLLRDTQTDCDELARGNHSFLTAHGSNVDMRIRSIAGDLAAAQARAEKAEREAEHQRLRSDGLRNDRNAADREHDQTKVETWDLITSALVVLSAPEVTPRLTWAFAQNTRERINAYVKRHKTPSEHNAQSHAPTDAAAASPDDRRVLGGSRSTEPAVSEGAGDTEAEGDERQLVHFLELHSPSSKFIRRIIDRRDARIAELEKRAVEPASLRFLLNHAPTCALLRSFAGLYTAPQAVCDCGAKDKHPNAGFMFNAKPAQPAASVKPKGNQWDDEKPGWSTMPSSDIPPPVDEPQAKVAWDARDTAVKFMERHGLPFAEARIREPMCELLIEVRETGAREAYEAVAKIVEAGKPDASHASTFTRADVEHALSWIAADVRAGGALATDAAAKAGS